MSDDLKSANQKLLDLQVSQQRNPPATSTAVSSASQQSDNVTHALAGAGGGLISMALTYPLITLSTRAQVESKKAQMSTLEAVKKIIDREGVSGLFAGLDSALFGISVTNFVYYYCTSRHLLSSSLHLLSSPAPAFPLPRIRTRRSSQC